MYKRESNTTIQAFKEGGCQRSGFPHTIISTQLLSAVSSPFSHLGHQDLLFGLLCWPVQLPVAVRQETSFLQVQVSLQVILAGAMML